jgi:diguanylate cyclase (GGDEF)-like protein
MANHDSLTELSNRRNLEVALENHVSHCNRYGPAGAVLILDLDNFKCINDSRGHSVGDEVIVTTARLLRHRLRESDLLARLGGDEFAVLLPAGDAAAARAVAQSLVEEIRASAATIAGERISLTVSIGVAVFDDVERSADEMLANADLAMYDAKQLGRDRWVEFAGTQLDEPRSKARLTWINRIESDIDNDAFVIHAQPIVDLGTGATVQLELLLRMIDERGEIVPTDSFLYIAERYGLTNRMDAWVLAQAFDLLEATHADPAPVTLAVSLSATSVGDDELLAVLDGRVRAGGFAADRLVLQLTQAAATGDIAATRAFAERVRDLGCRLTLGSLGGDLGSISYLEHLPFDFIKLDGELVTDCLEDSSSRALIGNLVDLARSLGRHTIAEQVSNDRVHRFLHQRGVDHGQGFDLGPPVPLEHAVPAFTPHPEATSSATQLIIRGSNGGRAISAVGGSSAH